MEICNQCGIDVSFGSGNFVNRIPNFDDVETRIDNGLPYPLGNFMCANCDKRFEDDNYYQEHSDYE